MTELTILRTFLVLNLFYHRMDLLWSPIPLLHLVWLIMTPCYMTELTIQNGLRSSSQILLQVPLSRLKFYGDCALSVTDPCLWKGVWKGLNMQHLQESSNLFRKHIFLRMLFKIFSLNLSMYNVFWTVLLSGFSSKRTLVNIHYYYYYSLHLQTVAHLWP